MLFEVLDGFSSFDKQPEIDERHIGPFSPGACVVCTHFRNDLDEIVDHRGEAATAFSTLSKGVIDGTWGQMKPRIAIKKLVYDLLDFRLCNDVAVANDHQTNSTRFCRVFTLLHCLCRLFPDMR